MNGPSSEPTGPARVLMVPSAAMAITTSWRLLDEVSAVRAQLAGVIDPEARSPPVVEGRGPRVRWPGPSRSTSPPATVRI